ncbi:hypothetical protein GFL93_08335 [Rhizobium leguminosarum bv. viciae]|nr:hypothetical protein [Rhizobium leguminosarum bv. viciae]
MDDMGVSGVQNFDAPKLPCAEASFYCTKVSPIPLDRFRIRMAERTFGGFRTGRHWGSNEAGSIESGRFLSQGAKGVRARSLMSWPKRGSLARPVG